MEIINHNYRFVTRLVVNVVPPPMLPPPVPPTKTTIEPALLVNPCRRKIMEEEEDEHLETSPQPQKKKRKYMQNFKREWIQQFKWLKCSDGSKPTCSVCNIMIHCNLYNIKRHEVSETHKLNMKKVANSPKHDKIMNMNEAQQQHDKLVKKAELGLFSYKNIIYRFCWQIIYISLLHIYVQTQKLQNHWHVAELKLLMLQKSVWQVSK